MADTTSQSPTDVLMASLKGRTVKDMREVEETLAAAEADAAEDSGNDDGGSDAPASPVSEAVGKVPKKRSRSEPASASKKASAREMDPSTLLPDASTLQWSVRLTEPGVLGAVRTMFSSIKTALPDSTIRVIDTDKMTGIAVDGIDSAHIQITTGRYMCPVKTYDSKREDLQFKVRTQTLSSALANSDSQDSMVIYQNKGDNKLNLTTFNSLGRFVNQSIPLQDLSDVVQNLGELNFQYGFDVPLDWLGPAIAAAGNYAAAEVEIAVYDINESLLVLTATTHGDRGGSTNTLPIRVLGKKDEQPTIGVDGPVVGTHTFGRSMFYTDDKHADLLEKVPRTKRFFETTKPTYKSSFSAKYMSSMVKQWKSGDSMVTIFLKPVGTDGDVMSLQFNLDTTSVEKKSFVCFTLAALVPADDEEDGYGNGNGNGDGPE